MSRYAIITGAGGQDGSYLADLLLSKDYYVIGMIRRNSTRQTMHRIEHLFSHPRFQIVYGDITDMSSILHLLNIAKEKGACDSSHPLEFYNLAAQSHVQVSFEVPVYTTNADAMGTLNVLEAVRQLGMVSHTRIYQASTSELYGSAMPPQTEMTPFQPRSPYAISKLYSYWIVRNYREAYNMFAINGILFNHESERRGEEFVSRKVTRAVSRYHIDKTPLRIGNLYAKRDWGYAPDYVYGMWLMMQQDTPQDFVLATNVCYTVKQMIDVAYKVIGVDVRWEGEGLDEKGYDAKTGDTLVVIDPSYFRPTEVHHLQGDANLAKSVLGWKHTTSFEEMITRMVEHDLRT